MHNIYIFVCFYNDNVYITIMYSCAFIILIYRHILKFLVTILFNITISIMNDSHSDGCISVRLLNWM